MEESAEVSHEEAQQFAAENGLYFIETSAKTGENVEEAFLKTAQLIFQNIQDGSVNVNPEAGITKKIQVVDDSTHAESGDGDSCKC